MNRFTIAAGIASLLSLQALNLQAQDTFPNLEPLNSPNPIAQPVPDPLTPQPSYQPYQAPKAQETESSEFAKYPIWLLIKPDGIQFLQTQEEIATNQNAIPPSALLLGCVKVTFVGSAAAQKPDFQLNCEEFFLKGRYGTQQILEVQGAALTFSTKSQQLRFEGTDELPLEYHSTDAASVTRMQADEILLQLRRHAGGRQTTLKRKVGNRFVEVQAVSVEGSSFQVSAKNITALEIIANPAPKQNSPAGRDAPMWDPNAKPKPRNSNNAPPVYDDPS